MTIFQKIIDGAIPSYKVYEDDQFLAFLDISPVNKGHTLVIPKKPYATLLDMDPETVASILSVVQKVAKAVVGATKADGFNLMQNNGEAAGQEVAHFHFHIIPRFKDDGFSFNWQNKKYDEGEMKTFQEKITSLF